MAMRSSSAAFLLVFKFLVPLTGVNNNSTNPLNWGTIILKGKRGVW
jgi:hypothetical protein